ncbi:uncharacterized protein AMSG_10059 [Thecamonas trahens ATCC 50062]|uniref:Uncharacterized protein n=1 Tax=Thecamonas trahens ATCC 50062 TaxID=461836 RepID=A0A0L0DPN8_THETB|nr:hypothetical protein AMSG_10059 [Thecamonas trahens ATCC 50062]KNC54262.1 hypothetical protein AMSG_10059 [Thecamonas trahens ATCC 50062]|eukprot:XP_013753896.1 hypothetical protein AMSG_10059 [Thecamonas trahens ATCC 50062]
MSKLDEENAMLRAYRNASRELLKQADEERQSLLARVRTLELALKSALASSSIPRAYLETTTNLSNASYSGKWAETELDFSAIGLPMKDGDVGPIESVAWTDVEFGAGYAGSEPKMAPCAECASREELINALRQQIEAKLHRPG